MKRRVWIVVSDEHGKPEQGIELPDCYDFELTVDRDCEPDSISIPPPTFIRRLVQTVTITMKSTTCTRYVPRPDGQWSEDRPNGSSTAAIADHVQALPAPRRELRP